MVVEGYRGRAAPYLDRLAAPFLSWRPNRLSLVALLLAVLAGLMALSARWIGATVFLVVAVAIFLGGVFDVLDGEVARRTGQAGPRGDLLDHVLDRYADLAIVLGIAASGFVNPLLALLALVSLLLTSYMGTQAQAVGVGRVSEGLLGRADRLLLLTGATFLIGDLALPWPWAPQAPWVHLSLAGFSFTVLDLAMAWIVIAGQWTAIARAWTAYGRLPPTRAMPPPPPPPV